jgi:hypothetical protein
MIPCTVEGCAMCAGRSCASCDADDLVTSCEHDVVARHFGRAADEPVEARVPTKPLPGTMLADRLEVDPSDPDSVAHFLETWAHIVRTRRRFVIVLS